jgi:hypothetical protein
MVVCPFAEKVAPVRIVVFPLRETVPVPVWKVPAPEMAKLPEDCE